MKFIFILFTQCLLLCHSTPTPSVVSEDYGSEGGRVCKSTGVSTGDISSRQHVPPLPPILASDRTDPSICGNCPSGVPEKLFSECRVPSEQGATTLHDFFSENIEKSVNVSLSQYAGKVLLVVNVAGFWGFTPQYLALNALKERYENQPFEILGFPSNQFGLQEPGANASEILAVLKYIRPGDGFVPNFDMFAKSEVNGDNENPIYTFLKGGCPPPVQDFVPKAKLFYDPLHSDDIRWNFAKFLVNMKGQPLARYPEFLDPLDMIPHIDTLLGCI